MTDTTTARHCWLAFGPHLIEAYQAISRNSIVIICERCLEQFPTDQHLWQHQEHCDILTPPGHVVSQGNSCRVWQVDGAENPEYAVRLARLGRFFICNKIPQLQPDAFDFFVLTQNPSSHAEPPAIAGYFSREKGYIEGFNMSCLLILPPYQGCGYGKHLIELSYQLARNAGVIGTPERPLSVAGRRAFLAYWQSVLLPLICKSKTVSIAELSRTTGIAPLDVTVTLQSLGLVRMTSESKLVVVLPAMLLSWLHRRSPAHRGKEMAETSRSVSPDQQVPDALSSEPSAKRRPNATFPADNGDAQAEAKLSRHSEA